MTPDPELIEALRRAGTRAAYHLLRAGVEGLRALEAVIDELGTATRPTSSADPAPGRERIELE